MVDPTDAYSINKEQNGLLLFFFPFLSVQFSPKAIIWDTKHTSIVMGSLMWGVRAQVEELSSGNGAANIQES